MASLSDLNAKLDAAGEGVQPWKPSKEGDQIGGKVLSTGSFTHPEYGTSPTINIETEDGSVIVDGKAIKAAGQMRVSCFGAVLGSSFDENNVQAGDSLAIRFLGMKQGGGAAKYKNYAFVCEHPTTSSKLDDAAAAGSDFV